MVPKEQESHVHNTGEHAKNESISAMGLLTDVGWSNDSTRS